LEGIWQKGFKQDIVETKTAKSQGTTTHIQLLTIRVKIKNKKWKSISSLDSLSNCHSINSPSTTITHHMSSKKMYTCYQNLLDNFNTLLHPEYYSNYNKRAKAKNKLPFTPTLIICSDDTAIPLFIDNYTRFKENNGVKHQPR
jgi:hypothetical protein